MYVLGLNMGNLPGHRGSRIKCLSFEKRFPWAEVFIFSSHAFIFRTKAIYINCKLKLRVSGSQLAPCPDAQDSKRLVLHWECFRVLYFLKQSQVRSIQMSPISPVFLSNLSSQGIYLKHFHFLGKELCKYFQFYLSYT